MSKKLDSNETTESPEIDESRRKLLTLSFGQEAQTDEEPEQIVKFVEANISMTRRDILSLPAKAAAVLIAAKIAFLLPAEANAEYIADTYVSQIRMELDPSQVNDGDHQLLDSIPDRYGMEIIKPMLYYNHNVRGKLWTKNKMPFTPSVVFETSKWLDAFVAGKLNEIENNEIILNNAVSAKTPSEKDNKRMAEIIEKATTVNNANEKDWKPLLPLAKKIVKEIQKIVTSEQGEARRRKKSSPAQDTVYFPPLSFNPTLPANGDDYDDFEEFFTELRTFRTACDKLPFYNNDPRPQSYSWIVEMAYLLRDTAREYHSAACQREHAYAQIRSVAERIKDNKKLRARLLKIAGRKKPAPLVEKDFTESKKKDNTIRGRWGELLREEPNDRGQKGAIIELVEGVTNAARREIERAYEIDRCVPVIEENQQQQFVLTIIGNKKALKGANKQNLINTIGGVVNNNLP